MGDGNRNIALEMLKDNGKDISDIKDLKPGDPPPGGEKPAGEKPAGEKPEGEKPPGEKPEGEKPAGEKPAGEKPEGEKPPGEKPAEEKPVEINEDAVKAFLKSKGIEVNNLDDLKPKPKDPTPAEVEAAAAELRENALKHGLNNKLIKAADITAYEMDAKKTPREIMYPILMDKWKKEDEKLTQEELDERFSDYYKENLKEDSWERKERTALMNAQAKQYILNTHDKVIGMEDVFKDYQDLVTKAKTYNQQVEKVLNVGNLKLEPFNIEVDMEGGGKVTETYTFDFDKDSIAAVKEQLLSEDSFNRLGRGEISEEALAALARNALIQKELSKIVTTVARSHSNKLVLAAKAGRKGAIPVHTGDGTQEVNLPPKYNVAEELLKEAGR